MSSPASAARNVAFIGHSGTGKTTIVDHLAHHMGVGSRLGSVDNGTSISDFETEELERKHSFRATVIHASHAGRELNLVDCPGYPDFVGEVISALSAVEVAAVVVSAASRVTFSTRTLWKLAGEAGVGRLMIVTRNDAENTDFETLLAEIQEVFGDKCVPVSFPDGNGHDFKAVIDALDPAAAPEAFRPRAQAYYATLVERVAESDEALMTAFLDQGELPRETVLASLPKAIASGAVVPLLTVGAREDRGIEGLMRFLELHLPSPLDFPPRTATKDGQAVAIAPREDGPAILQVWKVVTDMHVGRITYLRVRSGVLRGDAQIYPKGAHKPVKLHGINVARGREGLKHVDAAPPGSLIAITKIEDFVLGTTVGTEAELPQVTPPRFPHPWTALSVRPKSAQDETKLAEGMRRLVVEDPCFHVRREETTHEMLLEGLGDLHLQIMIDRLRHRAKVEVETHLPRIPYKETVQGKAEGHYRHKKQSGGRGQFGEVFLRVMAKPRGSGFEFIDSVVGGSIPRNLIPAVDKGIREGLARGPIAGCEVIDVAVELYDGKYHDVDSDEASFKLAGRRAFFEGFLKARPALLEPIYELEIRVPSRFLGDITSDVNTKRGRIQGMDTDGDIQIIKAHLPLSEVQTYSTQLRSITAGEGSYAMSFVGYETAPPQVQEKVSSAYKHPEEAE
ncbi:MAG: elongation factor G [Planctomycetes bacterium]|nr:elongation factor G [Planctomycetota bacterium]